MVVTGESSKIQKAMMHGHLCDGRRCRVAASQNGMDATKPAAAKKRNRPDSDGIVEGAVERSSRNVNFAADF
jgi:hypothetical protein